MELSARVVTLELAQTFVIARDARDTTEVVQVEVRHAGRSGFGEAAPIERYDESAESALAYLEANADALGDDPFALDAIFDRLPREQFAARAALDAALHDLQGKLAARDGLDVERVRAVRGVTDLPLQVDVNEYWSLDEALEYLPQMDLQYCEQPLPAGS